MIASVAVVGVVVMLVNATSRLIEYDGAGLALGVWEPWLWEASSVPMVVALSPLIGRLMRLFPPQPGQVLRFALAHLAGGTAFSLLHVGGMVAIRKAVYAAVGSRYEFSHGRMAIELLYEWRKDLLTYAVIALGFWLWRNWRSPALETAPAAPTPGAQKLEVRDGPRTLFLDVSAISTVEAAGNYVEIHSDGRVHLARGTLASFEERLTAAGFLRIHRSRLVNPAHIRSYRSTASGDAEILLDDGRSVQGSRRYREALRGVQAF